MQKSLDSKDIGPALLSSDNAAVKRFSILFSYKSTFVDLSPDNFLACTETYFRGSSKFSNVLHKKLYVVLMNLMTALWHWKLRFVNV